MSCPTHIIPGTIFLFSLTGATAKRPALSTNHLLFEMPFDAFVL